METDFYTCYAFGEELRKAGDERFALLCDWHKQAPRGVRNFYSVAYSHFVYGRVPEDRHVYFSFKAAARAFDRGGADAVARDLWVRLDDHLSRVREVRVGAEPEFAGCLTLLELFIESVLPRLGVRDSAVNRASIGFMYRSYLAVQLAGVVAEVELFNRLVNIFGKSRVRWAGDDEEKTDVDLYFDGLPVSVKNYHGFDNYQFNKYRNKNDSPVMYLDRDLNCAVPHSEPYRVLDGGFKLWRYDHFDRDDFLSVVERLGGSPVDPEFVADFGCLGSSPIDDCLSAVRRSVYKVGSPEYVATTRTPDDELFWRATM